MLTPSYRSSPSPSWKGFCPSNHVHHPYPDPVFPVYNTVLSKSSFRTYSPVAGNGREDLLKPTPLGNQLHPASPAENSISRDTAEGQRIATKNNCTSSKKLLRFHNLGCKISLEQSLAMILDRRKDAPIGHGM